MGIAYCILYVREHIQLNLEYVLQHMHSTLLTARWLRETVGNMKVGIVS